MRLLDTTTAQFRWVEDPRSVRYAILSHVWTKPGDEGQQVEMTYQDICALHREHESGGHDGTPLLSRLTDKIRSFCELARAHGYDLGWVDSACIDQSSSSELSEAINSMFTWYRYANVCYVYLRDVDTPRDSPEREEQFRRSKWFARGWTLQELLAPNLVLFLSRDWKVIGSKHTLGALIEDITGIERAVLTYRKPLEFVSVACRMSWAASRETTRIEDEAYSLMGIFGVNMPTLYGEGRYAFVRLQEEILKYIPDQTIFAWGAVLPAPERPFTVSPPSEPTSATEGGLSSLLNVGPAWYGQLLAPSPKAFEGCSGLSPLSGEAFAIRYGFPAEAAYHSLYTTTPYGIHARFPLVTIQPATAIDMPQHTLALLACEDEVGRTIALCLRPVPGLGAFGNLYCVALMGVIPRDIVRLGLVRSLPSHVLTRDTSIPIDTVHYRTILLPQDEVERYVSHSRITLSQIYLLQRAVSEEMPAVMSCITVAAMIYADHPTLVKVRLSPWTNLLLPECYTVSSDDHGAVICGEQEHVTIRLGDCGCVASSQKLRLPGLLVSLQDAATRRLLAEECLHMHDLTSEVVLDLRGHPDFGTSRFRYTHPPDYASDRPWHQEPWNDRDGVSLKELVLRPTLEKSLSLRLSLTSNMDEISRLASEELVLTLGIELSINTSGATAAWTSHVVQPTGHATSATGNQNPVPGTTIAPTEQHLRRPSGPDWWWLATMCLDILRALFEAKYWFLICIVGWGLRELSFMALEACFVRL